MYQYAAKLVRIIDEAAKMADAGADIPALEEKLWQWLKMGWTRLRDDGVLVHWHPDAVEWVPFSPALNDYYKDAQEQRRGVIAERLKHAQATAHALAGKAVIFDDTDRSGRLH